MVAAAFGEQLSIEVTISGDGAWTDSKRINLPFFEIKNNQDRDALLGYLSHEAAHIKFDSFDVDDPDDELVFVNGRPINPFLFSLVNCIEDIRIENLMVKDKPGTLEWMDITFKKLIEDGQFKPAGDNAHPAEIIFDYIIRYVRHHFRNQTFVASQLDIAEQAFLDVLGFDLLQKVRLRLMAGMPNVHTPTDAFDLAKEIYRCIEQHDPKDDSNDKSDDGSNGSGQGDSNDKSDDDSNGSGQGDSNDKSDDSSNGSGQGDSDDKSDDGSNGSAQGDSDGSVQNAFAAAKETALNGKHDSFNDGMNTYKATINNKAKTVPKDVGNVLILRPTKVNSTTAYNGSHLLARSKSATNGLSAKLHGLVQEATRTRTYLDKAGLSLSNSDLYRYRVGDPNLFEQQTKGISIDTVVEITLDNSCSMASCARGVNPLIKVAIEAQVALASSLSLINGVSVTASLFPLGVHLADTHLQTLSPVNLKSEQESIKTLVNRLEQYADARGDSTPSATAMWNSIQNVLKSKRSRKIIFFITDGEPNADQESNLSYLIKMAEKEGIVIIGVGIGAIASRNNSLKQYFDNAMYIEDAKELKTKLFKTTKNLLIG